ncbi:MAG: sugar phosphate isomerase/epimerase [Armatimonadetes bacterium]|nr:sugar phosphate isomerase/epimerase [Armatimonadota bacterium]
MDIGISTLVCSSYVSAPDRDMFHCLHLLAELGVSAIEYNDQSLPRFWADGREQLLAVARRAKELGVRLWSAHNPCDKWDLSSPDEEHRAAGLTAHRAMMEILGEMGVEHFVVHHVGPSFSRGDPDALLRAEDSLYQLLPAAEKAGVVLLIENFVDLPANALVETVRKLGDKHLGIVIDVGHAHHSHMPVTAEGEIYAGAPFLRSLHIHDNHGPGTGDEHLPPGWGTIDWEAVLRALREVGYAGPFMMEVIRHTDKLRALDPDEATRQSVCAARNILAKYWTR